MYETNFILKSTIQNNNVITAKVKLNKTIRGAKFFELYLFCPLIYEGFNMLVRCDLVEENEHLARTGKVTYPSNMLSVTNFKNQMIRKTRIRDSKSTINEFEVVASLIHFFLIPESLENERLAKSYFQVIIYHTVN